MINTIALTIKTFEFPTVRPKNASIESPITDLAEHK